MKLFGKITGMFLAFIILVGVFCASDVLAKRYYSLATASTGGTWYLIGSGFANHVNKQLSDIKISAEITAGCLENWNLIKRGKTDIAFTNPDLVPRDAIHKVHGGVNKDQINQLIWSYQLSQLEWYVKKGSPIKSLKDIKGKKSCCWAPRNYYP